MSDTNKELTALLVEARDQLPLAASCWNQDDDRELADRNVQHVLGLINRINEALSTPHPETPAIDGAEVWERVQRVLSMPNAKKKTGEQFGEAIALSLGLTQTPAPLRGEVEAKAAAFDEVRRSCVLRDVATTIGALMDTMDGVLARHLAAPMPQSAGWVSDERVREALQELVDLRNKDYGSWRGVWSEAWNKAQAALRGE